MKQYCVSLLFWLLVSSSLSLAQAPKPPLLDRFRVDFTDKKGTTYSIARPWEFLSSRALMRRIRYGIPLTLDDLPLAERYVDAVKTIEGIKVLNRSRWFNSITVQADSNQIAKIRKLPFVRTVAAVGKTRRPRASVPAEQGIVDISIPLAPI